MANKPTSMMIAHHPHQVTAHLLNVGAPHLDKDGKMLPNSEDLRFRFFSFEMSKNGVLQMYCTTSWLLPFPEANARSRHENVVFVKTICDSRKDATGRINNGNWNIMLQMLETKALFGNQFPEKKDAEGKVIGREEARSPYNSIVLDGHMTLGLVPTRDFNQKKHMSEMQLIISLWKKSQKADINSTDYSESVTMAMQLYEKYVQNALEDGAIQMSGLLYASPNGIQPTYSLHESLMSATNPLLNFNTLKTHATAPITYPVHTNMVSGYFEGNMSKVQADVPLVNGDDLVYGVSPTKGNQNRMGMLIEGFGTDGQGKDTPCRLQLIDNDTRNNPRAEPLYDMLKLNPCIAVSGVLRTSRMYADNRSLSVIFMVEIQNYFAVSVMTLTKSDTSDFDGENIEEVDMSNLLFGEDTGAEISVADLVNNEAKKAAAAAQAGTSGRQRQRRGGRQTAPVDAGASAPDEGDDLPY